MKRMAAGMLAIVAMLALVACGGGNEQPAAPAAPATTGAAPAGGEAAAPAGTNAALNFTLVNATGYDIKDVPPALRVQVDYIKVGKFDKAQICSTRRYVGSRNQCFFRTLRSPFALEEIPG